MGFRPQGFFTVQFVVFYERYYHLFVLLGCAATSSGLDYLLRPLSCLPKRSFQSLQFSPSSPSSSVRFSPDQSNPIQSFRTQQESGQADHFGLLTAGSPSLSSSNISLASSVWLFSRRSTRSAGSSCG